MAGSLRLTVLEGRQMVPMDTCMPMHTRSVSHHNTRAYFHTVGTSDPYCEIHFNGEKRLTNTVFRTLNPKWDGEREQVFLVDKPVNTVMFKVFDYDAVGENDFMGVVHLTLGGPDTARSDTVWLDMVGRKGNSDDAALTRRYGGLGQIRVRYSYTYYDLSRYFASEHLLRQLDGTVDGAEFVKATPTPLPDFDVIADNLSRLAQHMTNFSWPYLQIKRLTVGYEHVLSPKPVDAAAPKKEGQEEEFELTVSMVTEGRWRIFLLFTAVCLMGFIPFGMAQRLGRAALPFSLLLLFRYGGRHAAEKAKEGAGPFLFMTSKEFLHVFCGVNSRYIADVERKRKGEGDGIVGTVLSGVQGAVKIIPGTGLLGTGMKKGVGFINSGVKGVLNTVGAGGASLTPATVVDEPTEADKKRQACVKESIRQASPWIASVAAWLDAIRSVALWERQSAAERAFKRYLVFFLLFALAPLPPPSVVVWAIFAYIYFVSPLYHTDRERYTRLHVISGGLDCLEARFGGVVHRLLGRTPPPSENEAAAALHRGIDVGTVVVVSFEEEQAVHDAGGKVVGHEWASQEAEGRVVAVGTGSYTIDWLDDGASDPFEIEKQFVKKKAVDAAADGGAAAAAGAGQQPLQAGAPLGASFSGLQVGARVVVQYEQEEEDGAWVERREHGHLVKVKREGGGTKVMVDWGDSDSLYECDARFVEPVRGAVEKPAAAARRHSRPPKSVSSTSAKLSAADAPPASLVLVEREGGGSVSAAPAVVVRHLDGERVEVRWVDRTADGSPRAAEDEAAGETHTCPLSRIVTTLNFSTGDKVSVVVEREAEGSEGAAQAEWVQAVCPAVIVDLKGKVATVRWTDRDGDDTYCTPLWHLRAADATLSAVPPAGATEGAASVRAGDAVLVAVEKEEGHTGSGVWKREECKAVVKAVDGAFVEVSWEDGDDSGSESYRTPAVHVRKA